uniref:ARAD1B14278p n=1 Tax=Blastobotrys adeninivorans TaxID=409370 RepID=A0A060T5T1_BLAAD
MPSALEDPTQPPHYRPDFVAPELEPYTVLLKDRQTTATIYPISSADQLPMGLLAFLCDEFNAEIDRGDTYPLFDMLHIDTFQNYWFGSFAGVMLIGSAPVLEERRQWEKECLGTFYIKPNYPGRCSHVCTGGFLVNAGIRRKGIGRTLAECYLDWAPKLGYTYSVFNLVFETNLAARRIWESLNFKRIGRIKGAGILKGHEHAVDALIYGRELVEPSEEPVGELRFDKIKYYLETGRYPPNSDRQEKSRLRSSAAHYSLRDGVLMLKDREVVAEPERQIQIATQIHMQNHAGINRTTSTIAEKYHWTRIKETVAMAIRNCAECRQSSRPPPKRAKKEFSDDEEDAMASMLDNSSHNPHSHVGAGHPGAHPHAAHGHGQHDLRRVNAAVAAAVNQDPSLLTTDLNLGPDVDDTHGLIAAVAAAQQRRNDQRSQGHGPSQDVRQPQQQQYHQYFQSAQDTGRHDDIPVDPQMESAFEDHGHGGEEIAIARALIQANDSPDQDDNNIF